MRTERRIAAWKCDRCGNIDETLIQMVTGEEQVMTMDESAAVAPLPNGWVNIRLSWSQGTSLLADLCATCAETVDGYIQKRYDLVKPEEDVKSEPEPKKPTRKRTAKKAT